MYTFMYTFMYMDSRVAIDYSACYKLYFCATLCCLWTHYLSVQQLQELQAEKRILEQQRDIANTERERVITESVSLRKKLEAMMAQRQKDAKDLNAMRHVKEKAFSVRKP